MTNLLIVNLLHSINMYQCYGFYPSFMHVKIYLDMYLEKLIQKISLHFHNIILCHKDYLLNINIIII